MPLPRSARLCLALLALAPALARAEAAPDPNKLAVLNLFSPPSLLGIAGLLSQKSVAKAQALPNTTVLKPEQVETTLGRETLKQLARCELAGPCMANYLGALGAGRALVGTLDRDEVHYVVKVVLLDVATGRVISSGERTVLIASRQLEGDFEAMLPDVLSGKSQAPAKLTIKSNAKHARVLIDDRPYGEAPTTVELSPGKHELKLEKANYLPSQRYVEVQPGETQTVDVQLTLLPNRTDPDEAVAQPVAEKQTGPATGDDRLGGVVPISSVAALGVGVALVGLGTGFGITAHNIQTQAVDTDGDGALNITRSRAQDGKRDALVANICFGAAAAAGVAAVALYFLSGPSASAEKPAEKTSSPAPAPSASLVVLPGGAAVAVGGSF